MDSIQIKRFVELCRRAGLKPSYIAQRMGLRLSSLKHYLEVHPKKTIKTTLQTIEELVAQIRYLKTYLKMQHAVTPKPRASRGRPKKTK
jgi:hypothetical protein